MKNSPTSSPSDAPAFPMRINKYLAWKGLSTRRGADTLIEKGVVWIGSKRAQLGDAVNESDVVKVTSGAAKRDYHYIAFYKPKGIITHSPQGDEEDIKSFTAKTKVLKGLFPVGRLDKASHGLIILTDDGRITDRLLSPSKPHEKEYAVATVQKLRPSFAEHMQRGVRIEHEMTKPCKVAVTGDMSFKITLTEGKKHQIRRMVAAMHNEVADIKRIRIMNVKLGTMKPGEHRTIAGNELNELLSALGLPTK